LLRNPAIPYTPASMAKIAIPPPKAASMVTRRRALLDGSADGSVMNDKTSAQPS